MFQTPMLVSFVLAGSTFVTAVSQPVFISFNETLAGFDDFGGEIDDSIAVFDAAYMAGKKANRQMGFELHVLVSDVDTFLADPMHAGVCTGTVWADNVTKGNQHVAVGPKGEIDIFDGGVRMPIHELGMEYTLPFVGGDGRDYILRGVKHMPGNKCLGILSQITTLYCHVSRVETPPTPNTIVRKGVAKISAPAVIKLVESLRVGGGSSEVDRLEGFLKFATLLLGDVGHNCLNLTATKIEVDYFWASDGANGILLGMVQRPDELEIRITTYVAGNAPTMTKEILPLSALSKSKHWIAMGALNMSTSGCTGKINGTNIEFNFEELQNPRNNTFLPDEFTNGGPYEEVSDFVPIVTSQYGNVGVRSSVGALLFTSGIPLVRTHYTIPIGLGIIRWGMVSASQFKGTDLQIEILATPVYLTKTLGYITPKYVRFEGKEYHQDSLDDIVESANITSAGGLDANQTARTFGATIRLKTSALTQIDIKLHCSAPVEAFAFLEKEGSTYIHTTVMADCTASVSRALQKTVEYVSLGTNLIEAKE